MKTSLAIILFFGALSAWADSSPTPDAFAWRQHLHLAVPGEAIYRFELPAAVYAGSRRADLGDLRVFNGAGQVIPHALLTYAPPAQDDVKRSAASFFPLYRQANDKSGSLEVSVTQAAGGTLVATHLKPATASTTAATGYVIDASVVAGNKSALLLEWQPQPNGIVLPVVVEASDDLQAWQKIAPGTQLVDLRSGEQRLLRNRIELADNAAKYFRILWPAGQEGLKLTGSTVEVGAKIPAASRTHWTTVSVRTGAAAGEFLFESPGLPVTSLRIDLPEQNTIVPVSVFHRRDAKETWRNAADVVSYRLLRNGQDVRSPAIRFCCSTDSQWRLVFDQRGGGIGSGSPTVEVGWEPQQGILVARGNPPFVLAYGNSSVSPNGFSPTNLVPGYRPEQYPALPEATFEQPAMAATSQASAPKPARDWRSAALWVVLVAGVSLLAAMVWRLLGQMSSNKPEQ